MRPLVPLLALTLAAATPALAQGPSAVGVIMETGPQAGQSAPNFTLPWANRDTVSGGPTMPDFMLRRDLGKVVVLAFFTHAYTKENVTQMRAFTDRYQELFGDNVTVVGIGVDPLERQQRFAREYHVPFRLLSDPDQKVAGMYGARLGKGTNERSVYVLAPDGRVVLRKIGFDQNDPKAYAELKAAVARAPRAPAY